nr:AsmA family protein [uncultured Roseococcus sp.]
MRRRTIAILAAVSLIVGILPAALLAAWFILPGVELAPYVVDRASAAAGRRVAIDSLRVTPGRQVAVALRGVRLANMEGGTQPDMASLGSLDLEVELWPLLMRREVIVNSAAVDGLSVLLERDAAGQRNWRLNETPPQAPSAPGPDPESRRGFPLIRELRISGSDITIRTGSGQALRVRLDTASLLAPEADQPVRLMAEGAYNDVTLALDTTLGTYLEFWDVPKPFPLNMRVTAGGDTVLTLRGTATDPLNFDGIEADLVLEAPSPATLLAIGGAEGGPSVPVRLAGRMVRQDNLWRLTSVTGELDGAALSGPLLEMTEGASGQPDRLKVQLDFTRLDMNRLLGSSSREGGASSEDADLPLMVEERPDPMIETRLTAEDLRYGQVRATNALLQAAVVEDRIVVDELHLRSFGSRIQAKGQLERRGEEVAIQAEVAMREGNLETLRRAFGLRPLPLSGHLEARVIARGQGRTLNAASRTASLSAVVAMNNGQIQREIIEMASTDIRSLFRTPRGTTPVTCLLAVAEVRRGIGEVAPLRITAGTGTIAGIATFDLGRRQLDLVIGSQRDTTNFFALDIPMRVSGSFANPSIRPANWSPEGRARLAAGDTVAAVPAELRDFARGNRCYRVGANTIRPVPAASRSRQARNQARPARQQSAAQTRRNSR